MTLAQLRTWLAGLAEAEATIPARVVLDRLPAGELDAEPGAPLADLTVEQAGQLLGRSSSTVRQWCREGRFPGAVRRGGREWRLSTEDVNAFRAAERAGAAPPPTEPRAPRRAGPVDLGSWRKERTG